MSKTIMLVSLAALNLKAGTQFRESLDDDAVKDYAQKLKEWKESNTAKDADGNPLPKQPAMSEWTKCPLPPITVFETKEDGTINADGFHRIKGAKQAGLDEYPAEVKTGTKEDAVKYALQANASHGVRLTHADRHNKLKAALKIADYKELSSNALASKIGLSEFFVRTNRPATTAPKEVVVKAKGGGTRKMSTAGIGKKGGKKAAPKKAGKKSGKKGAAAATEGTAATEEEALAAALGVEGGASDESGTKKFDADTEKALSKILKAVSDITDPDKLEEAIRSGTIEISTANIRAMSMSSPERIALAYPLVFGEKRLKPAQAFAFLDKVPDADMKLGHLFNMTTARRGAVLEKAEGFHILIVPEAGYKLLKNLKLGSVFFAPEANAKEALEALKEA